MFALRGHTRCTQRRRRSHVSVLAPMSNLFPTSDQPYSIRALQTADIKTRTVSGRHQISAGGAHLIDGIAFGRQYFRRPDRPPVYIPPRKRQRISYCDTHEQDEQHVSSEIDDVPLRITNSDHHDVEIANDGHPRSILRDEQVLEKSEQPEVGTLRSGKRRRKSVTFDETSFSSTGPAFDGFEDQDAQAEDDSEDEDADDDDFQPSEEEKGDSDSELEGTSSDSRESSRPRNFNARSVHREFSNAVKAAIGSNSVSSSASSTSGSGATTSSSSLTSSDSGGMRQDTDDRMEKSEDTQVSMNSTSSPSSSDSSSDSSSSSGSEKSGGSKLATSAAAADAAAASDVKSGHATATVQNPPYQGLRRTVKRNRRRGELRRKRAMEKAAMAESGSDLAKRQQSLLDSIVETGADNTNATQEEHSLNPPTTEEQITASDLSHEVKPSETLHDVQLVRQNEESTASGVAQDESSITRTAVVPEIPVKRLRKRTAATFAPMATYLHAARASTESTSPAPAPSQLEAMETQETVRADTHAGQSDVEPPQKRVRLDVASSRRLLFGSLGLRAPRNKEEEEALRVKLNAKGLKPVTPPSVALLIDTVTNGHSNDASSVDPDRWRSKIRLRAVECVGEQIEYSAPPFPFVQRWDPLQKQKRGKKRKRGRRSISDQYVEEASYTQEDYDDVFEGIPDSPGHGLHNPERYAHTNGDNTDGLDYDDSVDDDITGLEDFALKAEMKIPPVLSDMEDLPSLPHNPTSLPAVKLSDITPSSVIAFKRLECTAETNYQPRLTAYQTALVTRVERNGELQLILAQRDRARPLTDGHNHRKAIKKHFEIAHDTDEDEEEDEEDLGHLDVTFDELIEPKLVRAAPTSAVPNIIIQDSVDPAPSAIAEEEVIQDSMFTNEDIADADLITASSNSDPIAMINTDRRSTHSQSQDVELPFVDALENQRGVNNVGFMEMMEIAA